MYKSGDFQDMPVSEILRNKWLQAGYMTEYQESRVFSEVNNLFTTFSQCYQFPVLITKLFNTLREVIAEGSGGIYFGRAYIPTSLLKTYAQCVSSLPHLQTLNLWQQFLVNCEDFLLRVDAGIAVQAGAFIASQLFSSFLCHFNMFNMMASQNNRSKIQELIERTEKFLFSNSKIFSLSDTHNNVAQISYLLLMVSFRKLENSFHIVNVSSKPTPCCGFAFLPHHEKIGCDVSKLCKPYLKADDKRISYCMFNLMMEECSRIQLHFDGDPKISTDDKRCIKSILSTLMKTTISSAPEDLSTTWDFNINTLSSDVYRVATIFSLITHLPQFLHFVDEIAKSAFCSFAINILISDEGNVNAEEFCITRRQCVVTFLNSSFFTESTKFQTAFMASIWDHMKRLVVKKRSSSEEVSLSEAYSLFSELCVATKEWTRYAKTTPKMKDNCTWTQTKTTAKRINSALKSKSIFISETIHSHRAEQLVKILNYLPLEYLQPGNQTRCLFGLSLTLFLLGNSPDHSDAELHNAVLEVVKSMVSICEGVRSVWLFDLVEPGPYIRAVINSVAKLEKQCSLESLMMPRVLFEHLFDLSSRNIVSLLALEDYYMELIENMHMNVSSGLAFQCLVRRLPQLLKRSYLQAQIREVCNRMTAKCCSSISSFLKHRQDELKNVQMRSLFIVSYAKLLTVVVESTTEVIAGEKQKYLKWLPRILDLVLNVIEDSKEYLETEAFTTLISEALSLQNNVVDVPEEVREKSWAALKKILEMKSRVYCESLNSILSQVTFPQKRDKNIHAVCRLKPVTCHTSDFSCAELSLEEEQLSVTMSPTEKKIVSCLVRQSSPEELDSMLRDVFTYAHLESPEASNIKVSQYVTQLCIIQSVLKACVEERKLQALSTVLQEYLTKLHFLLSQTCSSPRCLISITIPSLKFVSFVLGSKLEMLKLSLNCIKQCLHSCLIVDTDKYVDQPILFFVAFQSVWKVLSLLLTNHCFATLSNRIALLPCITKLLKSVVLAANQELILKQDAAAMQKIQQCADDMARLFITMSKNEIEFSKMVPYIVADYVDSVQNVTLHPDIKMLLIVGINRLLDMCNEDALKMLSVNINYSCREIYNALVKNYKTVRFTGQV